jgi:protein-serine/threonine kinase
MFFETQYNILTSDLLTPRSLRRRRLECALYDDAASSHEEKDKTRQDWATQESNHLRETRVMKVRGANAMKGMDFASSKYEAVKVSLSFYQY